VLVSLHGRQHVHAEHNSRQKATEVAQHIDLVSLDHHQAQDQREEEKDEDTAPSLCIELQVVPI